MDDQQPTPEPQGVLNAPLADQPPPPTPPVPPNRRRRRAARARARRDQRNAGRERGSPRHPKAPRQ